MAVTYPAFDPTSAGVAPRPGRRARGVMPRDLRQRMAAAAIDSSHHLIVEWFARDLRGLHPSKVTAEELSAYRETWGERVDVALGILDRLGYGQPRPAKPRQYRRHGYRRAQRLQNIVVVAVPRSLALRMAASADTHRSGPMEGFDRWGPFFSSTTLRADHFGLTAALCGLWKVRSRPGETFVEVNRTELASLIWARDSDYGGSDYDRIEQLLTGLELLEISAEVDNTRSRTGQPASESHILPSSPIKRVERLIGDRGVSAVEHAQAIEDASDDALRELYIADERAGEVTLRIHLADWVIDELTHMTHRPTLINLKVWRHLRPTDQRLYAFLQAQTPVAGDVNFYLAPPDRFTLGICDHRLDRVRRSVEQGLYNLRDADRRYRKGWGKAASEGTQLMKNGYPGFAVHVEGRSEPTFKATLGRCAPRRSADRRRLPASRMTAEQIRAELARTAAVTSSEVTSAVLARSREDSGSQPHRVSLARQGLSDSSDDAGAGAGA